MTNSELATAIVEAVLRKVEDTQSIGWEDAEERLMTKLEAIWVVEGLLGAGRAQEVQP